MKTIDKTVNDKKVIKEQDSISIMGEYEKLHGKIDYVKLNKEYQDSLGDIIV